MSFQILKNNNKVNPSNLMTITFTFNKLLVGNYGFQVHSALLIALLGGHDTQQNDTQHNDSQHNAIQHYSTRYWMLLCLVSHFLLLC